VKQAEKLVRLGIVRYLDPKAIFISDQIGISKPNPKLYLAALRELGLKPARSCTSGTASSTTSLPRSRSRW
jgi:putative hydrolase of the HAD superfamily